MVYMPGNKRLKIRFLNVEINPRHWLFYPLIVLILQLMFYSFFFSRDGYFAYLDLYEDKTKILNQVELLEHRKAQQQEHLNTLKNNPNSELLIQELFPFESSGEILKLEDNTDLLEGSIHLSGTKIMNFKTWYIIFASLIQIILFLYFYLSQNQYNSSSVKKQIV